MGSLINHVTDKHDKASESWSRKARFEDLRCSICTELISYEDRQIYLKTKKCATHAEYARRED